MKLKKYLYSQLAHSFFPIFLGLFFITSIIFLVRIASLTSVITINSLELGYLFLCAVPQIIFYTMPISFFISLVISLSKLAAEYELTVITSFGLNPIKILKIFFPLTLVLSIFLLVISTGLIPKTKFLTKQFLNIKKKEANFNIKASQFGQKFGDWLIYIEEKDDKIYKHTKLFKPQKGKEQFIISNKATLNNEKGNLSFKLDNGKAFLMDGNILNQINFKSMHINDTIAESDINHFTTSYEFWKKNLKENDDIDDLTVYILTSIFPLISLFLIITFGYFNPRYEKNRSVAYSILAIVIYYVFAKVIGDRLLLHSIYIIPPIWIISSYILYSKTVKKEY